MSRRYYFPGQITRPISDNTLEKSINGLLAELIGVPGYSAGKGQLQSNNMSSGISSNGSNTSAYTSQQSDEGSANHNSGGIDPITAGISGGIGLIRDLLGYAHADWAAKKSYERQNDFYDNHISMPAKVQEYQDAGLNPMGLAGAGVGATSSPGVDQGATPGLTDVAGIMSSLLNYKLGMKELAARNREIDVKKDDVASQIEYRATQKMYQEKVNDWFDRNNVASLEKIQAETQDALQRVRSGEADELLKYAGVEKTQAESALIFQEEMQKLWENSPEWKSVELELKRAQAQSGRANAQNLYADIERIQATRDNLINDSILKTAQTDIGRQQLINLGLNEEQIRFAIDHQDGDLIWDRVGRAVGIAKDVAVGVGSVMTPIKLGGLSTVGKSSTFTKEYDKNGNLKGSTQTFYTTESGKRNK